MAEEQDENREQIVRDLRPLPETSEAVAVTPLTYPARAGTQASLGP
jgi:hypothetical protein